MAPAAGKENTARWPTFRPFKPPLVKWRAIGRGEEVPGAQKKSRLREGTIFSRKKRLWVSQTWRGGKILKNARLQKMGLDNLLNQKNSDSFLTIWGRQLYGPLPFEISEICALVVSCWFILVFFVSSAFQMLKRSDVNEHGQSAESEQKVTPR